MRMIAVGDFLKIIGFDIFFSFRPSPDAATPAASICFGKVPLRFKFLGFHILQQTYHLGHWRWEVFFSSCVRGQSLAAGRFWKQTGFVYLMAGDFYFSFLLALALKINSVSMLACSLLGQICVILWTRNHCRDWWVLLYYLYSITLKQLFYSTVLSSWPGVEEYN